MNLKKNAIVLLPVIFGVTMLATNVFASTDEEYCQTSAIEEQIPADLRNDYIMECIEDLKNAENAENPVAEEADKIKE